jgi:Flp pilus assembly protein TadB
VQSQVLDNDALLTLVGQHAQIQDQIQSLWVALVLLVFVQIVGLVVVVAVAVWSVTTVLNSNNKRTGHLEDLWTSHQQKLQDALAVIVRTLRDNARSKSSAPDDSGGALWDGT